MNETVAKVMNAISAQLPALATLLPIGAEIKAGMGILSAFGQALFGNPQATPEEISDHIAANPDQSKAALQPLEDHAKAVAGAAVAATSVVPPDALPVTTTAMKDAVAFVTDDRPFSLSAVDNNGGAVLSQYLDSKELAALKGTF